MHTRYKGEGGGLVLSNIKTTIEHTNEQLKSIHNNTNKIVNKGLIERYESGKKQV